MISFRGGQLLSNGTRSGLGSGFGGVIRYLEQGPRERASLVSTANGEEALRSQDPGLPATREASPQRVAWTATRNLPTENPRHVAFYMREWANQNPRVKKPVYHFGAAIAPDEHLERREWEQAADRLLEKLGLSDHQAILALHTDCDHEHIHIVVNRVGPDGRAWKPSFDALKQQEALRELERELGLRVVPTRRDRRREITRDRTPGGDRRDLERPFARRVAEAALEDFRSATGWEDLEKRLAARGLRLGAAKRGGGVNVTDGSERAGISRVDRSLSGPRLAHRFGETYRLYRARIQERPALARSFATHRPLDPRSSEELAGEILGRVSSTRATFSTDHLRRLTDRHREGDRLLQLALRSSEVVSVGTDGSGLARYTTRDYLASERQLFAAADELAHRDLHRVPPERVTHLLDTRHGDLTAEQRAAVLHTTTGRDLAQVVGRAGSGKTHLTRAIAEVYGDAGYRVVGAALSGKAAQGLSEEAGISTRTLASIEHSWGRGHGKLGHRDLLLIDEAGMVDARQLGRVLHHVRVHRAKAILIGDPDQLKAIGAGDAYRGLIEVHGAVSVDTIFRQTEAWQRQASEDLASGKIDEALNVYRLNGRVRSLKTLEDARESLIMAYFDGRYLNPHDSVLLLAHRRKDARFLNQRIRELRRQAQELGPGVRVSGRELAAGDRILFTRNDHSGRYVRTLGRGPDGIQNGAFGTVIAAQPQRIHVRLDSGREVHFDPRAYDAVDHGYASTIHKAQGATVDRSYVLASPGLDRNLTYVALTRHRKSTLLVSDIETFPRFKDLLTSLARNPGKDLARDYAPLGRAERASRHIFDPKSRHQALQDALDRLERWDRLTERSQDLATRRAELPERGSIPDLTAKLEELATVPRWFDVEIRGIYRDPKAARVALENSRGEEALHDLRKSPARYGRLRGRRLLGTASRRREQALDTARRLADRLADLEERRKGYRKSLALAETFRRQSQILDRQLGSLGAERDEILAQIGQLAAPLTLEDLKQSLPEDRFKVVEELRHAEGAYLKPLRDHLGASGRQHPLTQATEKAVRRLVRQAPRHILRRLAPVEMRALLTTYRLARRSLRALDRIMGPRS